MIKRCMHGVAIATLVMLATVLGLAIFVSEQAAFGAIIAYAGLGALIIIIELN